MLTMIEFTFKEHLKKKILLLSVVLAVLFLGLYGTGLHYAAKDLEQDSIYSGVIFSQFLALGLYFGGFIVSFLAILSSVGTISSELESGVIQAVVTKPVSRARIVLGKFIGSGLFLFVYAGLFFLVIFYLVGWQTGMEMGGFWPAVAFFGFQPLVLLAVTLWGSTLMSTVANGVVIFTLYSVGIIGGMIEQMGWIIGSTTLKNSGIAASLIMPADALYRKIVHLVMPPTADLVTSLGQMGPFGSLAEPSGVMVGYAALYIVFFVGMAVFVFNRKDI